MKKTLFPIRNFLGLNRLDGADKVMDNQFFTVQNFYQATRGLFYKRNGSTSDVASIFGCATVNGLHRHYGPYKDPFTLYHCNPLGLSRPTPSTDLTLTEITGGNLFNGGAVTTVRLCYTMVGMGAEGTYNTKFRAGFVSTSDLDAWNQTGHQTFTPSANTKGIRITAPVFPQGIQSMNIFAAIGTSTEMTYIGSIPQSGGTLDFLGYIGPAAAASDTLSFLTGTATGGSLKPGTYYVALAWMCNSGVKENLSSTGAPTMMLLSSIVQVIVPVGKSVININLSTSGSTNGAKSCYVFVGTQRPEIGPMVCAGVVAGASQNFAINSIPSGVNAQSFNIRNQFSSATDTDQPSFYNGYAHAFLLESFRPSFLMKKPSSGSFTEVLPSRTYVARSVIAAGSGAGYDPIMGSPANSAQILTFGYIQSLQTIQAGVTLYDPSFAYFQGLSYFANGVDLLWQTDGYGLSPLLPEIGTYLSPIPRFLSVYQNSLLAGGGNANNQVYASNAINARNWAVGGTGTAIRFVTIGDLFGDSTTALGVFSRTTDAIDSPGSFFLSFKKHGCWMKNTFPDPVSGVGSPMETLSGRVGTVAPNSIVSTPLGVIFLGTDAYMYLIRGGGEPFRVGGSVRPLLAHLVGNDSLMSKVTAVYHDDHYKLSYPSTSSATANDAQLWADLRTMDNSPIIWTGPHTGINISSQIVLNGEGDDLSRIGAVVNQGTTAKLDDTSTYQDLGTTVVSVLQTKTFRWRMEAMLKRIMAMFMDVYFDSSFTHQVLVEMFADSTYFQSNQTISSGGATYDSSQFDQNLWSDAQYQGLPFFVDNTNLLGRTFYAKITHSSPAPFIIAELAISMKPERRSIV